MASSKKNLKFEYDAFGRRIAKHVYNNETAMLEKSTYYILDAQGNQLSMYEHFVEDNTAKFYLAERNIYGSSRLGSANDTINMFMPNVLPSYGIFGNRNYELTDHRNNIYTIISDIKYPISSDNSTIDSYEVGIVNIADYSPFGVQLDGRTFENDFYRRSFQNQEHHDEIKGKGNYMNYKYRGYDPRIGRLDWTLDPLAPKYPELTPYQFSSNRVLDGVELEGLEVENALTTLSKPKNLKVKLPEHGQTQYYSVIVANSKKTFDQFKTDFSKRPEYYLTNDKATFNAPVDGNGNKTQFKAGSYIKIDIAGPMNNCYIKVNSIKESDDGSLTAQFYTLEGHIEKGIINFTISKQNDDIKFEIRSNSEVDYGVLKVNVGGLHTENIARDQQKASWNSMLKKLSKKLGGEQKGLIQNSNVTPEQSHKINDMRSKYEGQ